MFFEEKFQEKLQSLIKGCLNAFKQEEFSERDRLVSFPPFPWEKGQDAIRVLIFHGGWAGGGGGSALTRRPDIFRNLLSHVSVTHLISNSLALSSVPPVSHVDLTSGSVLWSFLESDEVDICEPAIRCHALCPSRLKRAHLEGFDIDILDPGHRSVVDEVAAVVEVVDGGLNANTSSGDVKSSVPEVYFPATYIYCVQTESNATTLKDKCCTINEWKFGWWEPCHSQ